MFDYDYLFCLLLIFYGIVIQYDSLGGDSTLCSKTAMYFNDQTIYSNCTADDSLASSGVPQPALGSPPSFVSSGDRSSPGHYAEPNASSYFFRPTSLYRPSHRSPHHFLPISPQGAAVAGAPLPLSLPPGETAGQSGDAGGSMAASYRPARRFQQVTPQQGTASTLRAADYTLGNHHRLHHPAATSTVGR